MFGLSAVGLIHTVLGVLALGSGFGALVLHKEISSATRLGRVYLVTTVLVAATALAIFRHGGFGVGHGFAIATLVAVALGFAAERARLFGALRRYAMAVMYSVTLLFHLLPAFGETLTRLPADAPLAASPEAPILKNIFGVLSVLFLLGLALQLKWVRGQSGRQSSATG